MEYFLAFFVLFILLPLAVAGKSMAPWVPTRKRDIERLIEILDLKKGKHFFEIGCGDGRVSLSVAGAYPNSKVTGLEIAYPVWIFAKIRLLLSRKDNCTIVLGNAFKQDFSIYDAIYVYGMPDKMSAKIVPKFIKEAKTGAKLYSYVFSLPDEYKDQAISYGEKDEAKIHVLEKK